MLPKSTTPKLIDLMPLALASGVLCMVVPAYAQTDISSNPTPASVASTDQQATSNVEDPFALSAQPNNHADDPFAEDPFVSSPSQTLTTTADPYENINRKVFAFNQGVDNAVIKPVATAYKDNVPTVGKNGIGLFFNNLAKPWTAINQLLQGNPKQAAKSMGGFVVNTVTSLGFADPAGLHLALDTPKEDFGQTLGVWGVNSGAYIMLPFFGPSTLRDAGGRIVDAAGNPTTYSGLDTGGKLSLTALNAIDIRSSLLGLDDIFAGDQYTLIRDIYLQKRAYDINTHSLSPSLTDDIQPTPADMAIFDEVDTTH